MTNGAKNVEIVGVSSTPNTVFKDKPWPRKQKEAGPGGWQAGRG